MGCCFTFEFRHIEMCANTKFRQIDHTIFYLMSKREVCKLQGKYRCVKNGICTHLYLMEFAHVWFTFDFRQIEMFTFDFRQIEMGARFFLQRLAVCATKHFTWLNWFEYARYAWKQSGSGGWENLPTNFHPPLPSLSLSFFSRHA